MSKPQTPEEWKKQHGYYRRVGISTNLEQRKRDWKGEKKNLRNWRTYGPFKSREEAQKFEDQHDSTWEKHSGGRNPKEKSDWHAYTFNHDGPKK